MGPTVIGPPAAAGAAKSQSPPDTSRTNKLPEASPTNANPEFLLPAAGWDCTTAVVGITHCTLGFPERSSDKTTRQNCVDEHGCVPDMGIRSRNCPLLPGSSITSGGPVTLPPSASAHRGDALPFMKS